MQTFRQAFGQEKNCYRRCLALTIAALCCASALLAQPGPGDLPFSIQRIVIPPQRVAKELEKVRQGTLMVMPLADFDAQCERIRQSMQTREQKPRLLRSRYSAELVGRSLTSGSGQWVIMNPGPKDAILSVEGMNLALHRLKWERGERAILGDFDGNSPGLLLKQSGTQTCLLEWSARGAATSEGLSFSLQVPPCPITTFDIKLPADLWLSVAASAVIVMGPLETGSPNQRLWKIQMTGRTALEFSLRKLAELKGAAPTIFAQVESLQQLAPDRVSLHYEFNVDILQGSVRELILDGDAALQPFDVVLKGGEVKSWRWREAAPQKGAKSKAPKRPSGTLTILFRQPVQGKLYSLRVRALAPPPRSGVWRSPGLHVRDSFSRGETIKVQLSPDLQIGKWDNGSFQLTSTAMESDGTQLLTLAEATPQASSARRPSLILQDTGVELRTKETHQWHLDSRGAVLSAEWNYAVLRGSLHQLTVKLPEKSLGYSVEAVEMQPPEFFSSWRPAGKTLIVELKQALTPAKKAVLKIRLRAPFRDITARGRVVQYPELEPWDSTQREGTLAITVDRIFQSQLVKSSIPLAQIADAGGGSPANRPSYLFTFRDQPVRASLRLIPQPVQVQLRGKQTVVMSEHGADVQYRWEAEPLVGSPEFLDFRFSAGSPAALQVKSDDGGVRIHRWERLYLDEALPHLLQLGAGHGVAAALLEQALPAGALWRFHLSEPLRNKSTFTLEGTLPAGLSVDAWRRLALVMPNANAWEWFGGTLASELLPATGGPKAWSIPRMTPAQRLNAGLDIAIESPREPIVKVGARGFARVGTAPAELAHAPVHSLHFHADSSAGGARNLLVWTLPGKSTAAANELCDEAKVTTFVHRDGRLSHQVQFRLWHWRDRTCMIRFSPGITVDGVKIQGQWLERLDVVEHRDRVEIVLPVDQNSPFVRCEIHASARADGGYLPGIRAISMPHIDWPIRPFDIRFRCFLAKGLAPLHQEDLTPVGLPEGMGYDADALRWGRRVWRWGYGWLNGTRVDARADVLQRQQTVLAVEAQWRGQGHKELSLSDALERLAQRFAKDRLPLILDLAAFRSLGLEPTTLLTPAALVPSAARPCWESLGLVYVALPSGALLTSARRLESFNIDSGDAGSIDRTLREALLHGQDPSMTFIPALRWAHTPPSDMTEVIADGSTEWELLPASAPIASMVVVETPIGRLVGWIVSIFLGGFLWRINGLGKPLACLRTHLVVLTVGLLLAYGLPLTLVDLFVLPAMLVAGAGFLAFLIAFAGRKIVKETGGRSTLIKSASSAAIVGTIIIGIPWANAAQAPAARVYTVWIIDPTSPLHKGGQGGVATALVPIELKTKLADWENQANSLPRGAVLMSAKYAGKVKDQTATFDAQFDLYSARENANLVIPLTGVQLHEGVSLDGEPAFPTVDKNGYAIRIRDKGIHQLRLSFAAPTAATGDSLQLKFAIPKLPACEMSLQWSAPVQSVHLLHGLGAEPSPLNLRKSVKEWQAQLGPVSIVHLRWSGTTQAALAKSIDVREMHFWDLRPASLSLSSSLLYSIAKGSLAQIAVALPEGLHVRELAAEQTTPEESQALPVAIQRWRISGKGSQRRLTIDLGQPVTHRLLLNLEIVPQISLHAKQWLLKLPAPLQGKSVLGHVGYRIDAAELRSTAQNLAVQSISATDFAEAWSRQSRQIIPETSRAYRFKRKAIQARLELIVQPADRVVQMELTWLLDVYHADLSGRCTLTSSHEDMILQEFAVPAALTLANVHGAEVGRWNVRDNLLQVWLRRPCQHAELEITGWQRWDAGDPAQSERRGVSPPRERVAIPCVYPLHAQRASSKLLVQTVPGLKVETDRLRRLRPLLVPGAADQFLIEDVPYEGVFTVQTQAAPAKAQSLTRIQRAERGVELQCAIRLNSQHGQLAPFRLHVRNWPCDTMQLDAPAASVQRLKNATSKHAVWMIKHASGLPQEVYVTLRGHFTQDPQAAFSLPELELQQVPFSAQWLQWKDLEITDARRKIADDPASAEKISMFFHDFSAGTASAWKSAKKIGPVQATLPKFSSRPQLRILGSLEQLRLDDHPSWRHQADYWIHVLEPVNVRVVFPAPTEQFHVFIDDRLQVSDAARSKEFNLSLSATSQPQHVRMCWRYAAGASSVELPRMDPPAWDQVPMPAQQRIVWVPAGMTLLGRDVLVQPTFLARLFHQASIQMRIADSLAEEHTKTGEDHSSSILDHQQQFHGDMRLAELWLPLDKTALSKSAASELQQRKNRLLQDNRQRAREHGYEPQRLIAEKTKRAVAACVPDAANGDAALPWIVPADTTRIALRFASAQAYSANGRHAELVLLIAISLLVVSYLRHFLAILHEIVPEVILAVILVAMGLFGIGLIGLAAASGLIALRCFWIVKDAHLRLQRHAAEIQS